MNRAAVWAGLLLAAAFAWIGVVAVANGMGATTGTMGYGFIAFAAVWTLMMAAMMLPSIGPFAVLYTRTFAVGRGARTVGFALGYMLVWVAAAVPAFALAWVGDRVVGHHPNWAIALSVLIFAAFGLYQLTSLKDRCLSHCRSPIAFVVHYGSYRGRTRDVRVGLHHGGYCIACCWALMLLLFAFGLMNLFAMAVVAMAVYVEKAWRHGLGFARVIGSVGIALAVVVLFVPSIATGLHHTMNMSMQMGGR